MRKSNNRRGFTLIELMIVVVIIGILAALAIPRFVPMATKSKQSEAKGLLKQILTMEQTYFQEHGVYWAGGPGNRGDQDALATIGVMIPPTARYDYTVAIAGATFTATAAAATEDLDGDGTVDTWTMDQDGNLVCTIDDAAD